MQTFNLDLAAKRVIPLLYVKQDDVGKKISVALTNNDNAYTIPGDAVFSVWYSGTSGVGNYTAINGRSAFSVSGNKVTVELISQMLQNKGSGQMCLVMNKADGSQLGLWNIPYCVEEIPGEGSKEATAYYTAFSEAVNKMGVAGVESASHPGCYYRTVDGVTEWLNPPMMTGIEYRTTERYLGKPVYVKSYQIGSLPNASSADIPYGVANLNRVVSCWGNTNTGMVLPNVSAISTHMITLVTSADYLRVTTGIDRSALSAVVTLKYTKTTD